MGGSLKIHILAIHAKAKPYKCLSCEYSATTKGAMNQHVTGVHSGIKPFTCHQCSYASSFKHNLKTHINLKHKSQSEIKNENDTIDTDNLQENLEDFENSEEVNEYPSDLLLDDDTEAILDE